MVEQIFMCVSVCDFVCVSVLVKPKVWAASDFHLHRLRCVFDFNQDADSVFFPSSFYFFCTAVLYCFDL